VEHNVTVALSGLTISNGNSIAYDGFPRPDDFEGGGILNLGTLTVSGCAVSNNKAGPPDTAGGGSGGGICNFGTLTVSNSTLSGNSAQYGGGIYNGGTLTVSGCTVSYNFSGTSGDGGGIYNFNGCTLTVSTSTFFYNVPDNISGSYTDGGGNSFS
jgi:hypothetical protein